MSDYISKSALLDMIDVDVTKTEKNINKITKPSELASKKYAQLVSQLNTLKTYKKIIKEQPTANEKEIIRKPMERIINRLKEKSEEHRELAFDMQQKGFSDMAGKLYDKRLAYIDAIEIVKEEGGISD